MMDRRGCARRTLATWLRIWKRMPATCLRGGRLPLTYANERTSGDQRVTTAYALVFPVAMITKVIVVQFLV